MANINVKNGRVDKIGSAIIMSIVEQFIAVECASAVQYIFLVRNYYAKYQAHHSNYLIIDISIIYICAM